jgi:four helix bundle protein
MTYRNLDVLDAAQQVADGIDELIEQYPRQLLHIPQLRRSAQSIAANIAEGFGRGPGGDRTRSLTIARGETEETISHLYANFRVKRLSAKDYWPRRNKLVVIAKMLNSLIASS